MRIGWSSLYSTALKPQYLHENMIIFTTCMTLNPRIYYVATVREFEVSAKLLNAVIDSQLKSYDEK